MNYYRIDFKGVKPITEMEYLSRKKSSLIP